MFWCRNKKISLEFISSCLQHINFGFLTITIEIFFNMASSFDVLDQHCFLKEGIEF